MKLKLLAIICTTFAVTACSIKIEERRCERDLDIHLKYQDSCAVESQPYEGEGGNNGYASEANADNVSSASNVNGSAAATNTGDSGAIGNGAGAGAATDNGAGAATDNGAGAATENGPGVAPVATPKIEEIYDDVLDL